ncbi:MAG: tetratricopeptide repeat protein, partial [Bosea sp. (in: a-proteobacteria)]
MVQLAHAVTSLNERWAAVVEGVMSHGRSTGPALGALLAEHPDCVRGHALKGLSALIMGKAEGRAVARSAVTDAEALMRGGAGWAGDIHYVRAIRLWLDGRPLEAAEAFERVLDRDPTDALAVKLSHSIRFMFGDKAGMLAALEPRMAAFSAPTTQSGYVMGCYAFALEENGAFHQAGEVGRRAVQLAPRDAWGRHAVAHVFEMTGDVSGGLAWLRDSATWEHCNNFGFHMWWHLALFELERGHVDDVLQLYDQRIRAEHSDDFRDISNAASLLARLEFEGVDVGSRWDELAVLSAARIDDHCTIFADLHYLLALAGAGNRNGAAALASSLMLHADEASETGHIAREIGVALSDAVIAFHDRRYGAVVDRLMPLRVRIQRIGGSDAQRDVFEQMLIESAARSGRHGVAIRLLADRLAQRGSCNRYAAQRLSRL